MDERGIPTEYGGYIMRSRTEARWAAFFDRLGWAWEYEPIDANWYIGDFVLLGRRPVLVEVKALMTYDELDGVGEDVARRLMGRWPHDVLVVGGTPMIGEGTSWRNPAIGVLLEWMDFEGTPKGWAAAQGLWCLCSECRQHGFFHSEQSYAVRVCGHYDGGSNCHEPDASKLRALWADASNAVRWTPT